MQPMQVVVVNQVQVGLRTSTAVFPGWMPVPMRAAMSMPTVPVTTAVSTSTVMPTASGSSGLLLAVLKLTCKD